MNKLKRTCLLFSLTILPEVNAIHPSAQENVSALNNVYTKEYCHALELAYGDNMMSEGGEEGINLIFQNINFKNKAALDFGSGLGGIAFYLAKKYRTKVIGVDINSKMIDIARHRTPPDLRDRVSFIVSNDGQSLPLPDASFDIIYSRGVLVHLTPVQKQFVFKEFFRVLKKGGVLVIHDFLSPKDEIWGHRMQELMESEKFPLYAMSPPVYQDYLERVGFKKIIFTDQSEIFCHYNDAAARQLEEPNVKEKFLKNSDEHTLIDHIKGYRNIAISMKQKEVISGHFVAYKE